MDKTSVSVEALQNEVDFYRQNQAIVEQEIRKLIEDNQKLSQQVENLLRERLQNARTAHVNNSDQQKETEELKKQIIIITKERDSLHVLWQTSQKTINALEAELRTYQNYEDHGKQYPNEDFRDIKLRLDTALQDYVELESKFKDLKKKQNILENDLKVKEKEIMSYKERGKELEDRLNKMTASLDEHKINLAAERKNNDDVKAQLLSCQKESSDKIRREIEAKSKVAEALQLYDLVTNQKNDAIKKISGLTGQLEKLKRNHATIRHELESQFRVEIEEVKEKYNEKVADMLLHIRNLDTELVEKGMLLNRVMRENKILQAEHEKHLKKQNEDLQAIDPKLAIAEQKLETMFQELVSSERRNIQVVCEKQCLAIDIQRIQDIHAREIKRRNWEEHLLKTQCEELKLQVEHLEKSLDETHQMISKLQTMLSSRTELSQKMVSTKEQELIELNKHLENQMDLNKKWKESYVEMTEKLKKRLFDIQTENKELRKILKMPCFDSDQDTSTN